MTTCGKNPKEHSCTTQMRSGLSPKSSDMTSWNVSWCSFPKTWSCQRNTRIIAFVPPASHCSTHLDLKGDTSPLSQATRVKLQSRPTVWSAPPPPKRKKCLMSSPRRLPPPPHQKEWRVKLCRNHQKNSSKWGYKSLTWRTLIQWKTMTKWSRGSWTNTPTFWIPKLQKACSMRLQKSRIQSRNNGQKAQRWSSTSQCNSQQFHFSLQQLSTTVHWTFLSFQRCISQTPTSPLTTTLESKIVEKLSKTKEIHTGTLKKRTQTSVLFDKDCQKKLTDCDGFYFYSVFLTLLSIAVIKLRWIYFFISKESAKKRTGINILFVWKNCASVKVRAAQKINQILGFFSGNTHWKILNILMESVLQGIHTLRTSEKYTLSIKTFRNTSVYSLKKNPNICSVSSENSLFVVITFTFFFPSCLFFFFFFFFFFLFQIFFFFFFFFSQSISTVIRRQMKLKQFIDWHIFSCQLWRWNRDCKSCGSGKWYVPFWKKKKCGIDNLNKGVVLPPRPPKSIEAWVSSHDQGTHMHSTTFE